MAKEKKWCVRVVPSDDPKWNDPGKETSGHRFFLSNVNLLASYLYMIQPKFGYVKVEIFERILQQVQYGGRWPSTGEGER
jgi:hypothetical protein